MPKKPIVRVVPVFAVLLLSFAGCVTAPGSDGKHLIDFDEAEVVAGADPGTYELVVRGTTPTPCYDVTFQPLVYIQQPEYWGIEVYAAAQPGACIQIIGRFEKRMSLQSATGSKGVEVIGKSLTQKLNVPPP